MRNLSFAVCILVVSALLFMGATLLPARPIELQIPDQSQTNFNFFSHPRMLAACDDYVYLVNREAGVDRIKIIDTSTGQTIATSGNLNPGLIDIAYNNGRIFLFYENQYLIKNSTNFNLLHTVNLTGTWDVFGLATISGTTVQVMFASGEDFGHHQLTQTGSSFTSTPTTTGFLLDRIIMGISANSSGHLYFLASSPFNHTRFFVLRAGSNTPIPAHCEGFSNVRSFNMFAGNFVFISGQSIIMNQLPKVTPEPGESMYTHLSYEPIFIYARGVNEIYVIDARKHSIDLYDIHGEHLGVIAGSRGDDGGFFNSPTAISLVGEREFLVADYSSMIRQVNRNTDTLPTQFIPHTLITTPSAMAFNNHEIVYIYDRTNRVFRFNINTGGQVGVPFTGFGNITQLIPCPVTQRIFALDVGDQMVRIIGGPSIPFALNTNTRGAVDHITGELVLINAVGSAFGVVNIVTHQLFLPVDYILRDITVDTLGNRMVLVQHRTTRAVELHHDDFILPLDGATVRPVPSLQFDRLNNHLYWIGERHAIEGIDLSDMADDKLWSFGHHDTPDNDWRAITPLSVTHAPLFAAITAGQTPLLFRYPTSLSPITRLATAQQRTFMILERYATFDGEVFNYAHVIAGGIEGYINHRFINWTINYYDDGPYLLGDNNIFNIGRVIWNNVPIFKFPISTAPNAIRFPTPLPKNFNAHGDVFPNRGLEIVRQINTGTAPFYEIRLDPSGNVNPGGLYRGFVEMAQIINFFEAPSLDLFRPNARVVLPSGTPHIQVFRNSNGTDPNGDTLRSGTQIRVLGELNRNNRFTRIEYWDEDVQRLKQGYIYTRHIVEDGWSIWQILGIVAAGVGAAIAIFFVIRHIRNRRRQY